MTRKTMIVGRAIALLGVLAVIGCSGIPPPLSMRIPATTPKAPPVMTGVRITHRLGSEDGDNPAVVEALRTKLKRKYLIDGELIAAIEEAKNFIKFVQLPPGPHELKVEAIKQGVLTLGAERSEWECVYQFYLDEGDLGGFNAASPENASPHGFVGVTEWALTEPGGECS
jgi:hypothetical protein